MNLPAGKTQSPFAPAPQTLGYRMPAEWARHEATWLAWPHNQETWPGKRLKKAEEVFLQMMESLLPHETVHLLVPSERQGEEIRQRLEKMGIRTANLACHAIRTVDAWIRDYGPTFIVNSKGEKAWLKWVFNAWGNKYESLKEDTHVFETSASLIPAPFFSVPIVLEGGSIEVNGEGTCLVTEQCLLNPNRNPQLNREKIEQILKGSLGVDQIVWLGEGIEGDDTDGHIDDIARFVSPDTVLMVQEENPSDPNCAVLKENWERLLRAENPKKGKWNLVPLPMPASVLSGGVRLPASYANFYIANRVVLLPAFGDRQDERARRILRELFPGREIIPIRCEDLVYGLGAIHCVTQQEPAS